MLILSSRKSAIEKGSIMDEKLQSLQRLIERSGEETTISIVVVPNHGRKAEVVRWLHSRIPGCIVLEKADSVLAACERRAANQDATGTRGFIVPSIGDAEDRAILLSALNIYVDRFRMEVRGPVVFILDNEECRDLQTQAADLFDRRSGVFRVPEESF